MENAAATGAYLAAGLKARAQVQEVRGAGLFIGAELADGALASRVVNAMRANGVLISASGPAGNVLKIRPPLVLTQAHADLLLTALDGALADG